MSVTSKLISTTISYPTLRGYSTYQFATNLKPKITYLTYPYIAVIKHIKIIETKCLTLFKRRLSVYL